MNQFIGRHLKCDFFNNWPKPNCTYLCNVVSNQYSYHYYWISFKPKYIQVYAINAIKYHYLRHLGKYLLVSNK